MRQIIPFLQRCLSGRIVDERKGWVFHHITMTAARWTMTDQITYILPGSTTEIPLMHVESLQEAISEAYLVNYTRFSMVRKKDQEDKDAGMKLSRSTRVGWTNDNKRGS